MQHKRAVLCRRLDGADRVKFAIAANRRADAVAPQAHLKLAHVRCSDSYSELDSSFQSNYALRKQIMELMRHFA